MSIKPKYDLYFLSLRPIAWLWSKYFFVIVVCVELFSHLTLLSYVDISTHFFRVMDTSIKNMSAQVLQNEIPCLFTVCSCCRDFSAETEACILVCPIQSAPEQMAPLFCRSLWSRMPFCLWTPAKKFYGSAFPLIFPQLFTAIPFQPASVTPQQVSAVGENSCLGCSGRIQVRWVLQ